MKPLKIAVCGAATASEELSRLAFQVGAELARREAILFTGAGRGVMAAANQGAKSNGGTTLGIYPTAQPNPDDADESIDLAIHTGLGQGRSRVLVLSAQAVIAVGGE